MERGLLLLKAQARLDSGRSSKPFCKNREESRPQPFETHEGSATREIRTVSKGQLPAWPEDQNPTIDFAIRPWHKYPKLSPV